MFRLMFQKILHKKWMVLCLLIGNILMVSVAVAQPMYQHASFQRMLTDEFALYEENNGIWPATLTFSASMKHDETGYNELTLEKIKGLPDKLKVGCHELIVQNGLVISTSISTMNKSESQQNKLSLGSLSNLDDKIDIIAGSMYSDTVNENGVFEAIVSEECMVKRNLLLNEEMYFPYLFDSNGEKVRMKIIGVFRAKDKSDPYWVKTPEEYFTNAFVDPDLFAEHFLGENAKNNTLKNTWYLQLEYSDLTPEKFGSFNATTKALMNSKFYSAIMSDPPYMEIMQSYLDNSNRIKVTLTILQVPLLVLLSAFLFMICGQMLSMEQNEISLMKSRGAGKGQILLLYFLQNVALMLLSLVIGLPFGKLLCSMLGSASAFMEFGSRRTLNMVFTEEVWIYAAGAILLSLLITIIPVFSYSGITIVNLKQRKSHSKRPLWQKLYLDLILIGVSLYGYYSFTSTSASRIAIDVMNGKALDPLLFLSSSVFILGLGLFCIRLHPWIIKVIYRPFKKLWSPSAYASFLQILRTGSKQHFIMVFLILTVALGIFDSTVARTIVANAEKNETYLSGADLKIKEVWKDNYTIVKRYPGTPFVYVEPDYAKYLESDQITSAAQVFYDDKAFMNQKNNTKFNFTLMGINTKEFGETAQIPEGLLPVHFNKYLNSLGSSKNGILVSVNFRDKLGYKLGDSITYNAYDNRNPYPLACTGVIIGFFDYWPSYSSTAFKTNSDGTTDVVDSYLVVANISAMRDKWGTIPYQVWLKAEDTSFIYDLFDKNEVSMTYFNDNQANLRAIRKDTLFQGTNGILTMSFIIILTLCGIGYLIYWILSIKSRELLFGILRAMGMRRKEVIRMLINEQICTGLYSIAAGTGIGWISSKLFIPILQTAYSTNNQVLPLQLITQTFDMYRLFIVIALVLLICLLVIARIVSMMNITKALKLGED